MFRRFTLPCYRKAMEYAHSRAVELTWYDRDRDLRPFIFDYLEVGISGLFPSIDHTVPADVSFDNNRYFIDKLIKALQT